MKVRDTTKIHIDDVFRLQFIFQERDLKCNDLRKHYDALDSVHSTGARYSEIGLHSSKESLCWSRLSPWKKIITHLIEAYNFQIYIHSSSGLSVWIESLVPNSISYLATPPWHTSSSWGWRGHPRPLSPLCFASHHLLRHLENKGTFMVGSGYTALSMILERMEINLFQCKSSKCQIT